MDIPKKPLAVSRAKKKLPVELDWGPGIPKDRLRYINAKEEALVKQFRKTKAVRDYAGIPAYPDPGDTAAGEKGKGGVSSGKTTGKGPSGGGLGQGGQGKGPSGAGQGPNSSPKTSSAGSKSSSSPSSSANRAGSGSKAPNAAAQAASDKLKAKTSGPASPKAPAGPALGGTNRTMGPSKPPNAAAAAAAQKLNASKGLQKASSQPKSIQSMINANTAKYPSRGDTPGSQVTDKYNVPNWGSDIGAVMRREAQDIGVPNAYVDNSPQRFHDWGIQKLSDFYGRTPREISEMARTTYGEAANQGPLGMAAVSNTMENRLNYGRTYGGFGRGNVDRMLSKFDANGYDYGVRKGVPEGGNPAYQNAKVGTEGMTGGLMGMSDALDRYSDFSMTAPAAVKNATHYYNPRDAKPKWGKGFTAYGDHVFGNPDPGPTATRVAGLRENTGLGSVGLATAVPERSDDLASQPPQAIPAPSSVGMLGPQQAPAQAPAATMVAGDPRASMKPGSYPAAEAMGSPPGYFSQFGMTAQDMDTLKQQAMKDFSFGQLMEMRKNMDALPGFMGPITKDQQRMAQQPQERVLGVENYVDTSGIRDPQAATMGPPQGPLPASIPGFSPPGLQNNFRGTAGVAYTGKVPGWGYSPLADGRSTPDNPKSGWSSPSTFTADNFSPEAAPGDAVPEDNGQTYSDSPIQGPSNPMQEGPQVEDPGVTKQRQTKYASRGATIGSVIAGPLGAVIGGTLGWQMGKTTPGQRKAIAGNRQALNANVQSINQLAEERGGKGNPQMRVTERGLQDVLTDPAKVAANPQAYTTLEQMLAALAQGIDPETGKPI